MTTNTPKNIMKQLSQKGISERSTSSITTIDSIDSPQPTSYYFGSSQHQMSGFSSCSNQLFTDNSISQFSQRFHENSPSQSTLEKKESTPQLQPSVDTLIQFGNDMSSFNRIDSHNKLTLSSLTQLALNQKGISVFNEIREQNEEMSNYDDEDAEEEHCIWDDTKLEDVGIDTSNFTEKQNGKFLTFYQLFRLRSYAYQPEYVSRMDTINEVNTISKHCDQEFTMKSLANQQLYLDNRYPQQARKVKVNPQINRAQTSRNQSRSNQKNTTFNKNNSRDKIKLTNNIFHLITTQPLQQQQQQKQQQLHNGAMNSQQNSKESNKIIVLEDYQVPTPKASVTSYKKQQQSKQLQKVNKQETVQVNEQESRNESHDQRIKNYSNKRKKLRIQHSQSHKLIDSKNIPIKKIILNQEYYCDTESSLDEEFITSSFVTKIYDFPISPRLQTLCDGDKIVEWEDDLSLYKKEITIKETTQSVLKYLEQRTQENEQQQNYLRERVKPALNSYRSPSQIKRNRINLAHENIKTIQINLSSIESKHKVKVA